MSLDPHLIGLFDVFRPPSHWIVLCLYTGAVVTATDVSVCVLFAASGSRDSSMEFNGTPASAEMSPISQTSPISMSPLSGSPLSSGINSPIAGNGAGSMDKSVLMKIHSRRYRE